MVDDTTPSDVDVADQYESTALIRAAEGGQTEIAQALIAAGADVNAEDQLGCTASIFARRKGHFEIAGMLSLAGANEPDWC